MTPTALLIDADNIAASHFPLILKSARTLGRVVVARAYCDATKPSEWMQAQGLRVVHAGAGKNAADILLCIEAMELALAQEIRNFVLVTSDGDFTHLAIRLRELGACVSGIGDQRAPEKLRGACETFEVLAPTLKASAAPIQKVAPKTTNVVAMPQSVPKPVSLPVKPAVSAQDKITARVVKLLQRPEHAAGLTLQQLNKLMQAGGPIALGDLGVKTWRSWLVARPEYFALDPKGPDAKVRMVRAKHSASA